MSTHKITNCYDTLCSHINSGTLAHAGDYRPVSGPDPLEPGSDEWLALFKDIEKPALPIIYQRLHARTERYKAHLAALEALL